MWHILYICCVYIYSHNERLMTCKRVYIAYKEGDQGSDSLKGVDVP